ncbi:MAG TPA: rhomboid family intramembrane serine protease [Chitinophagaceae bacterium]
MSEFRPTRFEILPLIIKNLLIVNGLVFFAQFTFERMGSPWLEHTFALHDVHSVYFKPHQLITHLFMHGGFGHIFLNMFVLWMFGSTLENIWGPKRFLLFYIVCGLGAAGLHLLTLYFQNEPVMQIFHRLPLDQQLELLYAENFRINTPTVGASGAVYGCLAAFGYLFPNSLIYVYFLFPLKAKWVVLLLIGAELWMGVQNSAGDNVAHWAHLGGALVGFLLVLYWNRTNRRKFY